MMFGATKRAGTTSSGVEAFSSPAQKPPARELTAGSDYLRDRASEQVTLDSSRARDQRAESSEPAAAELTAQPLALGGPLELQALSRLVVLRISPHHEPDCCKLSAHRAASFLTGLKNAVQNVRTHHQSRP